MAKESGKIIESALSCGVPTFGVIRMVRVCVDCALVAKGVVSATFTSRSTEVGVIPKSGLLVRFIVPKGKGVSKSVVKATFWKVRLLPEEPP